MMSDQFSKPHKILEAEDDGNKIYAIELQENPYDGIMFNYGKVSFSEDEAADKLCIHFEYDILKDNDKEYDLKEFETYIGDLLQEIMLFEMQRNNLIFTGGTDAHREDNIIESDSQ